MSRVLPVRTSAILTDDNKSGANPVVSVPANGAWPTVTVASGDFIADLTLAEADIFPDITVTLYEVAPNGSMFVSAIQPEPGDIIITLIDVNEAAELSGNAAVITHSGKLVPLGFGFTVIQSELFKAMLLDRT